MDKKMFDLKNKPKEVYEWHRECSGTWHHWEMSVFHGHVVLHVEGKQSMGYWGQIQLHEHYHPDNESIYETEIVGTPEECANNLEIKWKDLACKDYKSTFYINKDSK